MIPLALLLLVLGIALSLWLKVYALIPATFFAWAAAVSFAQSESLSLLQTVAAAFLCGACLQFGYFVGGILVDYRVAHTKKHVFLVTRR